MTTVHIYGAAGYAALEAIRWIDAHPYLTLGVLESRSHAGEPVAVHAPLLRTLDRFFDAEGTVLESATPGDIVMLAGSHGAAQAIVPELLARNIRTIDLSADYRFDAAAVYGFPALYRGRIATAALVANPGCYPTATLLATLPLRAFSVERIIVDAKSGITGAGRNPTVASLFAEVQADVRAYSLQGHRHEPEIAMQWRAAGLDARLHFTPHVVPLARGMLVDGYAVLAKPAEAERVISAYQDAYADDPFTRILAGDRAPSLPGVVGTNEAEIHVSVQGDVVRVLCAIDNLGRGASAQALQNINIMLGYPEETGLARRAIAC